MLCRQKVNQIKKKNDDIDIVSDTNYWEMRCDVLDIKKTPSLTILDNENWFYNWIQQKK